MKLLKILLFGIFTVYLAKAPISIDVTMIQKEKELFESIVIGCNRNIEEHFRNLLLAPCIDNVLVLKCLVRLFQNPEINSLVGNLARSDSGYNCELSITSVGEHYNLQIKVGERRSEIQSLTKQFTTRPVTKKIFTAEGVIPE